MTDILENVTISTPLKRVEVLKRWVDMGDGTYAEQGVGGSGGSGSGGGGGVGGEYTTVAPSQTAKILGTTGAVGDYLEGLTVTPLTLSPGQVTLLDGVTGVALFVGGAASVTTLIPFFIALGIHSVSGPWKVTTGANVSVVGIGNFT